MRKYIWALPTHGLARNRYDFGVTVRMGTLFCLSLQRQRLEMVTGLTGTEVRDGHWSKNWLLKLTKKVQSWTGDGAGRLDWTRHGRSRSK